MSAAEVVIAAFFAILVGIAVLASASGPKTPTCEELGGASVRDGFTHVWVGKSLVLVPKYRCEGAR